MLEVASEKLTERECVKHFRQAQERGGVDGRSWPSFQFGECKIDLALTKQVFGNRLISIVQRKMEIAISPFVLNEHFRQVVPQNN